MIFVLTNSGTSNGWGRPIAVFDNKRKLREFATNEFKKNYPEAIDIEVKTTNNQENIGIEITGKSTNRGHGYAARFEIFVFQSLNPTNSDGTNYNFFDE